MKVNHYGLMITSFFIAILLNAFKISGWLSFIWPVWIVIVLFYWVYHFPDKINLGTAWLIGLFLDVLYGTILGEHALAMIITTYLFMRALTILRHYPRGLQGFYIAFLLVIYHLIVLSVEWALHQAQIQWLSTFTQIVLSSAVCIVIWPILTSFFNRIQGYRLR